MVVIDRIYRVEVMGQYNYTMAVEVLVLGGLMNRIPLIWTIIKTPI